MTNLKEPEECESKEEIRNQIDRIDYEILNLFSRRLDYARAIVKFKKPDLNDFIDSERKTLVLNQRAEWAEKLGLDKNIYKQIFQKLVDHTISLEMDLVDQSIQKKGSNV